MSLGGLRSKHFRLRLRLAGGLGLLLLTWTLAVEAAGQATGQAAPPERVPVNAGTAPTGAAPQARASGKPAAGRLASPGSVRQPATPLASGLGVAGRGGLAAPPPLETASLSPDRSRDLYGSGPQPQRTRVKDVASIEGIRDNQLIGFGIVVGLRGTGDTQQAVFPVQTLLSTLQRMGITVPLTGNNSAANMQVKNLAAVFVEATLPPFSRTGSKLDLTVSSAGDARSLEGGLLLMTPLYGPDGQIYAQAQGPLVLGGYQVTGGGSAKQVNHPTTARVPGGGLVERLVPFDLKQMHTVDVVLNDADFHTAERMAASINAVLKRDRARVADSRRVEIVPEPGEDLPALLDEVEGVEIDVYPRARVVVNERTGTVVIGGKVRLQPVSILHGGLSINVIVENQVSQPGPFSNGTTQVVQQTTLQAQDKPVNRIELKEGATVEDLVQELQAIGAGARDVISILQGMKAAGALEADLEVL